MTGAGGPDREPMTSREALQEVSDVWRGGTWRQRWKLVLTVVLMVALLAGAAVLVDTADHALDRLTDRHPVAFGWSCTGAFVLGVLFFRPLRLATLAMLKILGLAAPFIGTIFAANYVLERFLPREQADTVLVLCVMLPVTVLMFYVLAFAARKPATGKEGPLRRAARWWGGKFPSKARVGILTTTAAYAREEREKRAAQKTEHRD